MFYLIHNDNNLGLRYGPELIRKIFLILGLIFCCSNAGLNPAAAHNPLTQESDSRYGDVNQYHYRCKDYWIDISQSGLGTSLRIYDKGSVK